MRKLVVFFTLLFTFCTSIIPYPAFAVQPKISVFVDNLPLSSDANPLLMNGRTMVPFRAAAEALNKKVTWDSQARSVTATDGKTIIKLTVNNKTAYINNLPTKLDVPPRITGGRTLVPLRFFSEAFDSKVSWDSKNYIIKIFSAPKAMTVLGYYALGDKTTSSWTSLFGVPYPSSSKGNTDLINEVALGWYSLDQQGNLLTKSTTGWQRPDGWEKVLETADTYRLKTEMVVHLTDSNGTISKLISNSSAINNAAKQIAEESLQFQGVNLDMEGLGLNESGDKLTNTRRNFTAFVKQLSNELKANNRTLSISLHPLNSVYKGYDYKALGQIADKIIVMAYDYGPKPEPWQSVEKAIVLAKNEVSSEKLLLGISAPSENADSVIAKIGLAKKYGLNGIALWRLGIIPENMMNSLRSTISVRNDF